MRYLLALLVVAACTLFARDISVVVDDYNIVDFKKEIESLKLSNDAVAKVEIEDGDGILSKVRIFGKEIGSASYIVKFRDKSSQNGLISVVVDSRYLKKAIEKLNKSIGFEQFSNGKVIIDGEFLDDKEKRRVFEIIKKGAIDIENNLIDLTTTKNPPLMIKAKMYIAEINNKVGEEYKTSLDFAKTVDVGDSVMPLQVSKALGESVKLTGGLTTVANLLGGNFNLSATLNFLKERNVARVLDETLLLLVEGKSVDFHAGGTIMIRVQSVTGDGTPTSEVREMPYGLSIKLAASTILDERFVNMEIDTSSSALDWVNGVDGLPATTERRVSTNIVAESGKTIVLSGLLNQEDAKMSSKVPLLGDIPIIGALFSSKNFQEGNSELVFFITPYIINLKDEPYEEIPTMKNILKNDYFTEDNPESDYNKTKIGEDKEIHRAVKRLLNVED